MTIGAWIVCSILALLIIGGAFFISCDSSTTSKVITWVVAIILIVAMFGGVYWYFHSTASGQRKLTDQRSDLANGIERTITVYTATGNILAQYQGKIDIESDKDYVKFDWNGKRYIYYNCFVEAIATIP